jgi:sec-independent protein translocase protein TatC
MKTFLQSFWRVITIPFRLLYNIIAWPFRMIKRGINFLNADVDDRPILDTFSNLAAEADARASFWEHIEALRMHLLRMLIGLAIGVGISFYFAKDIMAFLAVPVGGLDQLQAIEVTEELGVFMRVALMSGIAIMLPYIAFEIWLFAAPGLKASEKKTALLGIPFATVLFYGGMAFTFWFIIPPALSFLASFTEIAEVWTAAEYFGFVTGLMLWLGLFCEFPLVIYVLTRVGFVQPRLLIKQWRLAIVIIAIIAAAVTPTIDPVNMALVMLPMSVLYFASIGMSYLAYAARRRSMPAEAEEMP